MLWLAPYSSLPWSVWVVAHEHLLVDDRTGRHAANRHTGAKLAAS